MLKCFLRGVSPTHQHHGVYLSKDFSNNHNYRRPETVLHLYGLSEDSLGQIMAEAVENAPRTGNRRKIDRRPQRLYQSQNREEDFCLRQVV